MISTTRQEILLCVARLSTMSHVSAASQNGSRSSDDDIGGRRPRGGIDIRDDKDPEFDLKSAEHFLRRLARAHSELALQAILSDAQKAIRAWTHTPVPKNPSPEQEPDPRTYRWYCKVADDDRPIGVLVKHYSIDRATVYRIREKYRGIVRRAA